MSIELVPGTDMTYYLIAFDSEGKERTDDPDGIMSARVQEVLKTGSITDVFLINHGWKGDIPAAREQFNNWIVAMAACKEDAARMKTVRPGFSPLLVGLHWPSLPFGEEDFESTGVSFSATETDLPVELVDKYAERIADTPAAREALYTIFQAAIEDVAPDTLAEEVRQAYRVLNRESGLGSSGVAGAPGEDREPFDPDAAYLNASNQPVGFGGGTLNGILSPLVQLSFWKMKDRARRFGETGGFRLLTDLLKASEGMNLRFHLIGHSFGCIAVSAILGGPPGSKLPRPVNSVILVQGALSLWSYCSEIPKIPNKAGYFNRVISDRCVTGPIVTTQSEHDSAVGNLYPMAAGVASQVTYAINELPKYGALGAFGARGTGLEIVDLEILPVDQTYGFEVGKIYNLDSSKVICHGGGISGSHNDIAQPEVAHVVWSAAMTKV